MRGGDTAPGNGAHVAHRDDFATAREWGDACVAEAANCRLTPPEQPRATNVIDFAAARERIRASRRSRRDNS